MPYLAQDSKGMSAKGRLHSDLSSNRLACSVYLTYTAHSLFLHIDNTDNTLAAILPRELPVDVHATVVDKLFWAECLFHIVKKA